MLTKEMKAEIVGKYASNSKNTGSPAAQIALLSKRIDQIAQHLKSRKNDHSSRRGLLKIVGQRKALLRYLEQRDPAAYRKLQAELISK